MCGKGIKRKKMGGGGEIVLGLGEVSLCYMRQAQQYDGG